MEETELEVDDEQFNRLVEPLLLEYFEHGDTSDVRVSFFVCFYPPPKGTFTATLPPSYLKGGDINFTCINRLHYRFQGHFFGGGSMNSAPHHGLVPVCIGVNKTGKCSVYSQLNVRWHMERKSFITGSYLPLTAL